MTKYLKMTFLLFTFTVLIFAGRPALTYAQDGGLSSISLKDDTFALDDDLDIYDDTPSVRDPYEGYNRFMFKVNDKIYRHVLSPITKVYNFIVPKKVQSSFNNVVRLASTPKRLFNNLMQKKPKAAFIEFERLLINSTIGIGGLFDPAKGIFHLEQHSEDFGQTLGSYGVGNDGPYIVWPIIGPSTPRDTVGVIIDNVFSPFLWFSIYDVSPQDGFQAFSIAKRVNNYPYNIQKTYMRITNSAIDPYIALQDAYIQNRQKNIKE